MSNDYQKGRGWTDELPKRKNIRLQTHDYSSPGHYFVTICTRHYTYWLGDIRNGQMYPNAEGAIVQAEWYGLPDRFPGLELDEFIVMPNHLHGILVLTERLEYSQPTKKLRPTLSNIIDTFKGVMTYRIRRDTASNDFEWKRSFYDEIIRDASMLHDVRRYIATNPQRWLSDKLYGKDVHN